MRRQVGFSREVKDAWRAMRDDVALVFGIATRMPRLAPFAMLHVVRTIRND